MNPWTALLESLHSALIDELTERHPEPKPVLGMPIRKNQWIVPATAARDIWISEILQKAADGREQVGFACLTLDPSCASTLKVDAQTLWDALIRRAGTEFQRRGIAPKLSRGVQTDEKSQLPEKLTKTAQQPGRVIWIPIALGRGQVFLGVGI